MDVAKNYVRIVFRSMKKKEKILLLNGLLIQCVKKLLCGCLQHGKMFSVKAIISRFQAANIISCNNTDLSDDDDEKVANF